MFTRHLLVTPAAVLLGMHPMLSCAQEEEKPLVLIERVVNTKYREAVDAYNVLLRSKLTKPYIVKDGDNLSAIVKARYTIGQGQTPELYAPMVERIRELNEALQGNALIPGQKLDLPDLPPLQWKAAVTDDPKYGVPRIQTGPSYKASKSGGLSKFWESIYKNADYNIVEPALKSEPMVSQPRWTSPEVAKAELASEGGAVRKVLWDQPLIVSFADNGTHFAGTSIPADVKFIKDLVKRKAPPNEVVLFIIDDSWPDAQSFSESKAFMISAMDVVRKRFKLGDGLAVNKLKEAASTTFTFPAGYSQHAVSIKAALGDFEATTSKVRVVYMPLFVQQAWSRELWMELLFMVRCAFLMDEQFGTTQPYPIIRQEAEKFANEVVGAMPKETFDAIGRIQQSPITTLHAFAQLYARATGMPYFVNMSWTVKKKQLEFKPNSDADVAGVSLAAAGNDQLDVMNDTVYLAYRAKASPGDVLAVMNTDVEGSPMCKTSKLPLSGLNAFYGLAYDGRVQSTGACATSFATPRVAWLLALRHAYDSPLKDTGWGDWYGTLQKRVIALQGGQDVATAKRYWLPVSKLFAGL
ncbi:LysM peptidoglycan-binding domain-containing protein [Paucibacter sp. DJ4R-1]|nr:LysM peptidoglycan-binding domain-containing protein [Paucibacter sp. DJ4R-1]